MPYFYHATDWNSAQSIMRTGLQCGYGGLAGPGVYVCDTMGQARHRTRGGSDVVLCVETYNWPPSAPVVGNYVIYNPNWEIAGIHWHWDAWNGYA